MISTQSACSIHHQHGQRYLLHRAFPRVRKVWTKVVLRLTVKKLEFLSVVVKPNKGVPDP